MSIFSQSSYIFDPTNYYFWSGCLNFVVALISGLVVLRHNVNDRKHISFFLLSLTIVFWSGAYAVWQSSDNSETALFWSRGLMFGGMFMSVAVYYFNINVLELKGRKYTDIAKAMTMVFTVFLIADFTPLFVNRVEPALSFRFWPKPGPLFHPFLMVWVGLVIYTFYLLFRGFSQSHGRKKSQITVVLFGFLVAVSSGSTNYFLWYGIPIPPYLNPLVSVYVVAVAYATVKYSLLRPSLKAAAGTIASMMADAMFVVDGEKRIAVVNKAAADLTGIEKSSLIDSSICDVLPRFDEISGSCDGVCGDISGSGAFVLGAGKNQVPVSISLSRLTDRQGSGFVVICHDNRKMIEQVSTIRRRNKELDESRAKTAATLRQVEIEKKTAERERSRMETMLRGIGDGVVVVDEKGRITIMNDTARRMAHRGESEDLKGKDYREVFRLFDGKTGEDISDLIELSIEKHEVLRASPAAELRSESTDVGLPVTVSAAPLVDDRQMFGAVAVIQDDSRAREVSEMKSSFIDIASHQLKTPLTAVRWLLEMVQDGSGRLTKEQKTHIRAAHDSVLRQIRLVNELLNVSRIEKGRIAIDPEPTSVRELCDSVAEDVRPAASSKMVKISTLYDDSLGVALMDQVLVRQAILNLLSNSVKYTPQGGEVRLSGAQDDNWVTIEVEDNGIGIPKSQQSRIFQKFFRADNVISSGNDGNGLGLYLVRAVVNSSGGEVSFESEEGAGTKFRIRLPVSGVEKHAGDRGLILT